MNTISKLKLYSMKTIYIIGRTIYQGVDYKVASEEQDNWEFMLKDDGFKPVNPFNLFDPKDTTTEIKQKTMAGLVDSEAVLLLSNWNQTQWGRIEFQVAMWLHKTIYTEEDYLFTKRMGEILNYSKSE